MGCKYLLAMDAARALNAVCVLQNCHPSC